MTLEPPNVLSQDKEGLLALPLPLPYPFNVQNQHGVRTLKAGKVVLGNFHLYPIWGRKNLEKARRE